MEEIRLSIQAYDDRQALVTALANSGYFVRVERETYLATNTFFVIVQLKAKEATHEPK